MNDSVDEMIGLFFLPEIFLGGLLGGLIRWNHLLILTKAWKPMQSNTEQRHMTYDEVSSKGRNTTEPRNQTRLPFHDTGCL